MAGEFAKHFGVESWAYAVGRVHDVGKYSEGFQSRILRGGPKVDHSTAGAYELARSGQARLLSFCVAGHHGGLPNGGLSSDSSDEGTLVGRLKRACERSIPDYGSNWRGEVPRLGPLGLDPRPCPDDFIVPFFLRMVFSCLVDADYLCTERFMRGEGRDPLSFDSLQDLSDRLERRVRGFYPPKTPLNETRCRVLDACADMAEEAPGVFSLTVPTGGGKTYASLRFALRHATAPGNKMRRVIYAVPFTSIIGQNADVFREVLGCENVLEHHSNFDFDDVGGGGGDEASGLGARLRLAAENWDAPVVVTTNVQLFESLFASKTSRCRKLHNIAGSVIVLDEAQMLPTDYLEPCVRALAELVHRYGCTVVLCTATQPSLNGLFGKFGCSVREIAPDVEGLFERLRRVTYRYDGSMDDDEVARSLLSHRQVLCVVNSRKQARLLFDRLKAEAEDPEGVFHLSTCMHPAHRADTLDRIRLRLAEGGECRVVSTSLIEAGVDLDFPAVYRAVSGIDSIVQCAGRCNREGKRSASESIVHVFESGTAYSVPADVSHKAALTRDIVSRWGEARAAEECGSFDFGSLEAIGDYFSSLHRMRDTLDKKGILAMLGRCGKARVSPEIPGGIPSIPFSDAADAFRFIEEDTQTVIVSHPSIEREIEDLRSGFSTREGIRRISRFGVSVYENEIRELCSSGAVAALANGVWELLDEGLYRPDVGLDSSEAGGKGLFF